MPKYIGMVTIPDGRKFNAEVTCSNPEPDTGGVNWGDIEIWDEEWNPLDGDDYNELIPIPSLPEATAYLHEVVLDLLVETTVPEWD